MDTRPTSKQGRLIVATCSDGTRRTKEMQVALLPSGVGQGAPVTREEMAAIS